jgi:hypothetical protein
MGDWQPDREVRLREHSLYLWIVPAAVNGDWKWRYSDGKRMHTCRLHLRQHFQTVYKAELQVDGVEAAVGHVRVTGNKFEFTVEQGMRGFNGPVRFKGTVRGDRITGRALLGENGSGGKTEWIAQRKPGKAIPIDVSSSDKLEVDTVSKKQELPESTSAK